MAQCRGSTKKGNRCKRDARGESPFCAIHQDQEIRAREPSELGEWDNDAIITAVIGFAIIGLFFIMRRR